MTLFELNKGKANQSCQAGQLAYLCDVYFRQKKASTRRLRLLISSRIKQKTLDSLDSLKFLEEHETTDCEDILVQNVAIVVLNFSIFSNQFQV